MPSLILECNLKTEWIHIMQETVSYTKEPQLITENMIF